MFKLPKQTQKGKQTATKQKHQHNGEMKDFQHVRIYFFDMPVPAHTFPAKRKPPPRQPAAGSKQPQCESRSVQWKGKNNLSKIREN